MASATKFGVFSIFLSGFVFVPEKNTTQSSIAQLLKIEMTQMDREANLLLMVEKHETKGMPVKYPDFAKRVQTAMSDSGVTVLDIKTKLKITYEMARRYSLGQAMPRTDKMTKLALLLNTEPAALQFGLALPEQIGGKEKSKETWPFSINKKRYDALPKEEKERLDGLVGHTITAWEHSQQRKSKKTA